MGTVVTLSDIERVFEILAEFGLSREAVVIPLKPAQPGQKLVSRIQSETGLHGTRRGSIRFLDANQIRIRRSKRWSISASSESLKKSI
jgi:hypothetical protein